MMNFYTDIATGFAGLLIVIGILAPFIIQNSPMFTRFLFKKEMVALENHFIFSEIQLWLDAQIDYKCSIVPDKKRAELAKRVLRLRFECKKNYYRQLIGKLKNKKSITLQDICDAKSELNNEFDDKSSRENIPGIVIDKFHIHRSQSETASHYLYERILQYGNFRTDAEKLSAIFCVDLKDIYNSAIDIESVIMSLNGEINKILNSKET